jgi:hypothetical protein
MVTISLLIFNLNIANQPFKIYKGQKKQKHLLVATFEQYNLLKERSKNEIYHIKHIDKKKKNPVEEEFPMNFDDKFIDKQDVRWCSNCHFWKDRQIFYHTQEKDKRTFTFCRDCVNGEVRFKKKNKFFYYFREENVEYLSKKKRKSPMLMLPHQSNLQKLR